MPLLPRHAGSPLAHRRMAWGLLLLLSACAPAAAFAQGGADAELRQARDAAAVDPRRGIAILRGLAQQPKARQQLAVRLALDEAQCRVLTDVDAGDAVAVADAGLAAAGSDPPAPARDPWLRLRACRAGMLLELGQAQAGLEELDRVLGLTAEPADAGIHALAKLERGVYRSRSGKLEAGQSDLLQACEALRTLGPARDHALCLGHLASHYRRIGDVDEALKLLLPLREQARSRGETYDDSIYTFAIAQMQHSMRRWTDATASYREAIASNELLRDDVGIGFSEHGLAVALTLLGRPGEALVHIERGLALTSQASNPRQFETATITLAEVLMALGRVDQALAALDSVGAAVRRRNHLAMVQQWLTVRAQAMAASSRWHEAYQALSEAQGIDQVLQEQRLSGHSAKLRMQFNRSRDAEELASLRTLNEQGQRLRQAQAVALAMFVILLAIAAVVAVRALRRSRGLGRLASIDELTGVLNRRSLFACADQALQAARRQGTSVAVLMIDVDHFKLINDTHGHALGDRVLRQVALALAAGLRDQDRLGRVGGEEFVAVLPGASAHDAAQVAERMRSAIAASPIDDPTGPVPITVSIGVAAAADAVSAEAALARADEAMYRAKEGGRNAVVVA